MPIGLTRFNARHLPPTPNIIFIKPLPGSSASEAEAFLSRVAAICHPILTEHHFSVTTLEEYEPNPEFIGRNFNAGECIQLVLRSRSGGWLPFRSVVMVMMHELAHCKQMNHSRKFWEVRNGFAAEMRILWQKGYTGEGVWGRGRELDHGGFEDREAEWGGDEVPQSLCGGTYKSRGRKRKRAEKPKLTYAEREKKRVEKKFGKNGTVLGEDEFVKISLEGKYNSAKPRVAKSNRGRELRAQAALVRLGAQKDEEAESEEKLKLEPTKANIKEEEDEDWASSEEEHASTEDAIDLDGSKLLDRQGHGMVKVCDDEDADAVHIKQEMDELQGLWSVPEKKATRQSSGSNPDPAALNWKKNISNSSKSSKILPRKHPTSLLSQLEQRKLPYSTSSPTPNDPSQSQEAMSAHPVEKGTAEANCPICSMANDNSSWLCAACGHVLKPHLSPGSWKCRSRACQEHLYINAGDCGVCGICGSKKPR